MQFPELITKLLYLYDQSMTKIIGGYPSYFTNSNHDTMFNFVVKKNRLLSTSASIANDELFVIFNLSKYINPKNIYVIGNSYGISSIALSILFPKAKLVGIDKFRTEGIKFTNNILKKISASNKVLQGDSPKDNCKIIKENFKNKKLDLVLIDGLHTNKAQINDYNSIEPFLSKKSVVIFHDVINCKLTKSYHSLTKKYNLNNFLLNKTSSGMALSFKTKNLNNNLKNYLQFLSDDFNTLFKLSNLYIKKSVKAKISKKVKPFKMPSHPQK